MVEKLLRAAHARRLADVRHRRVLDVTVPTSPAVVDLEETLRGALVRVLPQAQRGPRACVDLLAAVMPLESSAEHDLRALDAWHHAFELGELHRLDPGSPEYGTFLAAYERVLIRRL